MKRIYVENIENNMFLDQENYNYLTKTLRYNGGEEILLFDGEKEVAAVFNKNNSITNIKIRRLKENCYMKLAIAEIKKERMEWLIEKITEIGVKDVYILKTDRSQNFLNKRRIEKIAIEASKQSQRVSIPNIIYYSLDEFLLKIDFNEWFFCSLNSKKKQINNNFNGAIIGPEGGWSEKEENTLSKHFESIYLGANVLRSETAAMIALSIINYVH